MLENILTASPAEIDGEIAEVQRQIAEQDQIVKHANRVERSAYSTAEEVQRTTDDAWEAQGKLVVLNSLLDALVKEYVRRGRWTRLYVVDNHDGHAHRTTACSTTYTSTDFYWFPEHSGKTDEEIVALTGGLTCLVCFGSQRAEIEKGRPSKIETPNQAKAREEREAQAAARDAKKAQAAANAIAALDGSPLLDDDGYVIKTLRSAQIKAVDALEQAGLDEIYADQTEDDPKRVEFLRGLAKGETAYAAYLIKAIAAKQGRPLADVADEMSAKTTKKLLPARKDESARKLAGKSAAEWYGRR